MVQKFVICADLADGGAAHFSQTVCEIKIRFVMFSQSAVLFHYIMMTAAFLFVDGKVACKIRCSLLLLLLSIELSVELRHHFLKCFLSFRVRTLVSLWSAFRRRSWRCECRSSVRPGRVRAQHEDCG